VRLVTSGSVGWYKSWALGEWSSPDPVPLFDLFMRNGVSLGEVARAKGVWRGVNRIAHLLRRNNRKRARANIAFHYDLGNDFYREWLDPSMTYSSALFEPRRRPGTAQQRKDRALLDRLELRPGQRCWRSAAAGGSLAEIAARITGVTVTGPDPVVRAEGLGRSRIAEAGLSTGSRSSSATIAMSWAASTRSPVSRWSRRSGRIMGRLPPDDRPRAEPGGPRGAPAYLDSRGAVRRLCGQRRLHPDLCFPGRHADQRGAVQAMAELAGLSWRDRTASASIMPRR
jgi:cyclopropane-fatty-acyl-phospholipid synthase